jgi:hypothetical protein
LALCLPCFISAQRGEQVASVTSPQTLTIQRGKSSTETLNISLKPGFHVNSNKPTDEFLIPLKLTWAAAPLQSKQITYPASEDVQVGPEKLRVFTGKFTISTEFYAPPQATPGVAMMQGKLHYQACDNQSCKRPATLDVQVPISIQ